MIKRIALVGNPNSGKTTLYNKITGANEYVGNRSGVTVDISRRELMGGAGIVYDLPGIYSLSPYSKEEKIARDFLKNDEADVILNIIDGCNFERNLYLTLQLLTYDIPVIALINMSDMLDKRGIRINYNGLSDILGIPVIPVSAKTRAGLNGAVALALSCSPTESESIKRARLIMHIKSVEESLSLSDPQIRLAHARYTVIERIKKEYVSVSGEKKSFTDKLDDILLNRILAIPIFLLVMASMFGITFGPIGSFLSDTADWALNFILIRPISVMLYFSNAPKEVCSLILNGIVGGIGSVIAFVPQILLLFLCLSFLEDTGYTSRVAFIMDSLLRGIGMSGKAFIPLVTGFGCTTPAVMAARILPGRRERLLTILLLPFMSCSAKLPIYALFTRVFFKDNQGIILFCLYILGIIMAILCGLILKNTAYFKSEPPFMMELPPYRLPSLRSTVYLMWDKGKGFLIRAGTVIFVTGMVVWVMQHFTFEFQFTHTPSTSILGVVGGAIAPMFTPLGFGFWEATVSLLAGLAAKEAVISSLYVLYGAETIAGGLISAFSPAAALSYMVFCLLYVPCISAFITIAKEMESRKWALFSLCLQMGTAYIVSFFVYIAGLTMH